MKLIILLACLTFTVCSSPHPIRTAKGSIEGTNEGNEDYMERMKFSSTSKCSTGKNQSPINFEDYPVDHGRRINFNFKSLQGGSIHVKQGRDNGHSMQWDTAQEGEFKLYDLMKKEYAFKQVHAHHKSEHTFKNQHSDLELHFVFQKEGATGTDDLAVVGVMCNKEKKRDVPLEQGVFFENLKRTQYGSMNQLRVEPFLKSLGNNFVTYSGSLTTPPCTENVKWHVFTGCYVPEDWLNVLTLKVAPKSMKANYRNVQNLNGRTVCASTETRDCYYNSYMKAPSAEEQLMAVLKELRSEFQL